MKSLEDKFNLPPMEVPVIEGDLITSGGEVIPVAQDETEENIEYDYRQTRSNLHSLLQQGGQALAYALEIAKQSEHPRAFEVVGELMSKLADVNGQLLDLSEKRQKLRGKIKPEAPEGATVTNNNAFFVGTPAELNKLISDMNKGDK